MIGKHRMTSGKHQLPSVSGRHIDDCLQKATDVFRKALHVFRSYPMLFEYVLNIHREYILIE